MLKGVNTLIVAKGKSVVELDLKNEKPDNEILVALLLGPTGNLRAPTARVGTTLLVGFSEQTYALFVA